MRVRLSGIPILAFLIALCGCSSPLGDSWTNGTSLKSPTANDAVGILRFPVTPLHDGRRYPKITTSQLTWVKVVGQAGKSAEADCPSNWILIGGGVSDTSNSSGLGTGKPNAGKTGWIASASGSSSQSVAFASCAAPGLFADFKWVSHTVSSGGAAGVSCGSDFALIMGYGTGGYLQYPDYTMGRYSVEGGSGSATAYASCVAVNAGAPYSYVVSQNWGATDAAAGCSSLGSNYVVVGGSDGTSQYPGPPTYFEHPDITGNSWKVHGPNPGIDGSNVLAHAACLPTAG